MQLPLSKPHWSQVGKRKTSFLPKPCRPTPLQVPSRGAHATDGALSLLDEELGEAEQVAALGEKGSTLATCLLDLLDVDGLLGDHLEHEGPVLLQLFLLVFRRRDDACGGLGVGHLLQGGQELGRHLAEVADHLVTLELGLLLRRLLLPLAAFALPLALVGVLVGLAALAHQCRRSTAQAVLAPCLPLPLPVLPLPSKTAAAE